MKCGHGFVSGVERVNYYGVLQTTGVHGSFVFL